MKEKLIIAHMKTAYNYAECSSAVRLQVGSIIVKDDAIISIGYNGQPAEWDNVCEDKIYMPADTGGWNDPDEIDKIWPYRDETGRYALKTKPTVLHAETNAISKLAKYKGGGDNAAIFITHAPCLPCALSIHQAGISSVFYAESYRDTDGLDFLAKCRIIVRQVNLGK